MTRNEMMRDRSAILFGAVIGLVLALQIELREAQGAFITSSTDILPPQVVVDFSQFSSGFTFTSSPVQVGGLVGEDITYSSTSAFSVVGSGDYDLAGNGQWDATLSFAAINTPADAITFTFNDGPVAAVGAFMNYATDSFGDLTITAYNSSNVIIETYDVTTLAPISTSGTNEGAFRGIALSSNDIASFQISGAFGVLTDLTFSRVDPAAVPEPGSLFLLCMGVASFWGLGWISKRRSNFVEV